MNRIARVALLAVGFLNALAVWHTCADFTCNFGMDKKHTEVAVGKVELKLNGESASVPSK